MKDKHLKAHIEVCGVISKQSGCPRRKFGAVIVNPERNTILATGYNGGPRGGEGPLCSGWFCERDGITEDMLKITNEGDVLRYYAKDGREVGSRVVGSADGTKSQEELVQTRQLLLDKYKPIKSGTFMERGCHHAEFNAIANAAADGVALSGAALIVTGEPCLMCAKLIHHAGITKVYCVRGGYLGGSEGPDYLRQHKVAVEYVEGEQDPRA